MAWSSMRSETGRKNFERQVFLFCKDGIFWSGKNEEPSHHHMVWYFEPNFVTSDGLLLHFCQITNAIFAQKKHLSFGVFVTCF